MKALLPEAQTPVIQVLIVLSFMTQHTHEPPLISSSGGELQMAEILYFTHRHANVWVETTTEQIIPERMNTFALCIYNAHQMTTF